MSPASSWRQGRTCGSWCGAPVSPRASTTSCRLAKSNAVAATPSTMPRSGKPWPAATSSTTAWWTPGCGCATHSVVPHQCRRPAACARRGPRRTVTQVCIHQHHRHIGNQRPAARHRGRSAQLERRRRLHRIPGGRGEPGHAVRAREGVAGGRDAYLDHLRARRLGPDPAWFAHRTRRHRAVPVFASASPPRWSVSKTLPAPCFWRPTGAASVSATSFPIVT